MSKQRTIITTDGEVDDMNSFLRLLLYANEMDIAGIILTSSMYHYAGNIEKGIEPYRWTGNEWIYNFIDEYAKVYDCLIAHGNYPTPEYLKSVTKIGNISHIGEMDEISEGSLLMEKIFLDDDLRPLYVQTWGGTNTTARALKSIEDKYKHTSMWDDIYKKVCDKVILYIILDQDITLADYILKHWKDLRIINDQSNFWHFAYAWKLHNDKLNNKLKASWCKEHLTQGSYMHNYALIGDGKTLDGELYDELRGTEDYLLKNPQYERYDFISEGDTPSFLYLIDNGLRSLENPSFGGWGGRFNNDSSFCANTVLDYNPYENRYEASYSLTRWFDDIQNDFASRIEWTKTADDSIVEHAPDLWIVEGNDIEACINDTMTLTAKSTSDIQYHWWHYFEADINQNRKLYDQEINQIGGMQIDIYAKGSKDEIEIINSNQSSIIFKVPETRSIGDTIHIVVEGISKGKYQLKHYQRIIIHIK